MAVDRGHPEISLTRQCELLGLARSTLYYAPRGESEENERLMRLMDQQYMHTPFYGVERMTQWLGREGEAVNVKRVRRLMRKMGLEAIYPKRRLSVPEDGQRRYPYLLEGLEVRRPNQVWAADITYVRMWRGWTYLVAVMDWFSRYVVSWRLSVSLEAEFCVAALAEALEMARPEIFNTDQGSQFGSDAFTGMLQEHGVAISMDGRGRVFDNIFVERLRRTVKYEEVYLKDYESVRAARESLGGYFGFYNRERPHQGLGYRTPWEVYCERGGEDADGALGARTVAGTPVALRAPSVPATVGPTDSLNDG